MGDTIDSAVDKAVGEAQSAAQTEQPNSAAASTASASLPAAPAAGSVVEPASSDLQHTEGQPESAQGTDDEILANPDWLTPARRATILRNARTRERTDLLTKLGVHPDANFDIVRQHVVGVASDPVAYARQLIDSLRRQGRWQDSAPAQPNAQPSTTQHADDPRLRVPTVFELPDPDLIADTADGRKGLYTKETLGLIVNNLEAHMRSQIQRELDQRFAPIEEDREAERIANVRREAFSQAADAVSTAEKTWPEFKRFKEQIGRDLLAANQRGDYSLTLESAYLRYYGPWATGEAARIADQSRRQTLQDIKNAPDPTTVVPGAAQARVPGPKAKRGDIFGNAVDKAVEKLGASI